MGTTQTPRATQMINFPVATTPEIDQLLALDAAVAFGVSGGKDSVAGLIATHNYLERIGHKGPRCAIHADLGRVEWATSLMKCEEAAEALGWDFVVVRRGAGDMMDRWLGRWQNNVKRYQELSCVQLILPWSTPSMRFCTSELKTQIIRSELKKRYPTHHIINATGIRAEESANRAKAAVAKPDAQLTRKSYLGFTWNPIHEARLDDVWALIESRGLERHEAYSKYNMTRVSCCFCIMSSGSDLENSSKVPEHASVYREMVDLEITSTFAFQSNKWLADVNPELLCSNTLERLQVAKRVAAERTALESRIPGHMLFSKGWPYSVPTITEATLLADIRVQVAAGLGIEIQCTTAQSVIERYEELIEIKRSKGLVDEGPELIPIRHVYQEQLALL